MPRLCITLIPNSMEKPIERKTADTITINTTPQVGEHAHVELILIKNGGASSFSMDNYQRVEAVGSD